MTDLTHMAESSANPYQSLNTLPFDPTKREHLDDKSTGDKIQNLT